MAMTSCCCGCLSLRQGTLGSAIFTIVLSALAFLGGGIILSTVQKAEDQGVNSELYDAERLVCYIVFGVYGFWLLLAALMILAVRVGNHWLLLPWMIYTTIIIALTMLNIMMTIPKIGLVFASTVLALQFCLSIVLFLANLYCLVCVVSYFKEVKSGKPQADGTGQPMDYKVFHNMA